MLRDKLAAHVWRRGRLERRKLLEASALAAENINLEEDQLSGKHRQWSTRCRANVAHIRAAFGVAVCRFREIYLVRPDGTYAISHQMRNASTRAANLRILVYLVIYDSGQVSLEHLLLAW